MNYYHYTGSNPKKSRKKYWLVSCLAVIVLSVSVFWILHRNNQVAAPLVQTKQKDVQNQTLASSVSVTPDLQPIVDTWLASQNARFSISIYDVQARQTIGQNNPSEVLFAASLYKIYVAYLALVDIQNGTMDPGEILTGEFTRKDCIDKMIRESNSQCGEAMMADIGQTTLNQRVKDISLTGTFFNGIRTSAADSALILQYIADKRDLNDENTAFLLDAMLTQEAKYKRGLQSGAPEAKWETKVGWNLDENYHDIGIMTVPDGRRFIVAILSQGQGSPDPIADFSQTIYAALTK